ncbi:MAG: glycosyltransferase family 2 protein [Caldilineales bacterium]
MTNHPIDFSVVIVNWNVRDLLRYCLLALAASSNLFMEGVDFMQFNRQRYRGQVIVVDNASHDGSQEMLRSQFPWVHTIANQQNLGFTAANNQGIAAASGRYVLLLNPDTQPDPHAVTALLDYAEAHPEVGVVGPQLRYGDGSPQSSRRRFPTAATFLLESTILQRWWPRNPVLSRYYALDLPDNLPTAVDWLVGACLLVRRAALDQVGLFDPGFFMYSEEMDLCRRIKQAGWQVHYLPQALVTHYEGKSSEQVVAARHRHFHQSRLRYIHKYHGHATAQRLRTFSRLNFTLLWAEEGIKWLSGAVIPRQRAQRAMRLERMAIYRQVQRDLGAYTFEKPSASRL